jgi:hypothetical protein
VATARRTGKAGILLACFAAIFSVAGHRTLADDSLQWRRGRSSVAESPVAQATPQFQSPSRRNAGVELVAYNETRSNRGGYGVEPSSGGVKFRSVIVHRNDQAEDAPRSAQLPATHNGTSSSNSNSNYFDELPDVDTLTMPDEEKSLLEDRPAANQTNRAPQTFQPPSQPIPAAPVTPITPVPSADEPGMIYGLNANSLEEEGQKAQEFCSQEIKDLKAATLNKISLNITITGRQGQDIPYECSIEDGSSYSGRCWSQTTYMWKASAICHKPLYFENEQLERYGHSWGPCIQPLVSGAHFFSRLPILPYCMGIEPPTECVYALGHYRPGDCAPYFCDAVPFTTRAGLFEAGAVVGAAAVLP